MHNIGLLVDIQYADVLKLIWLITDTNTDCFFFLYTFLLKLYIFLYCGIKTALSFVNLMMQHFHLIMFYGPTGVQHTVVNVPTEPPNDYLVWSLCSFIYGNFCCLGLAALICSVKVSLC
uniref:Uncharacterized protein n=1 Tax=Poecilia latipinna TaxID=48699 RepID=A0A3B3UBF0_9TELE